ncbi:MAG: 2-isopropylmalate synthase [Burkholderiales bacterium]|nr:2-isopropylmalate synthase [Burkholderiales bacterium]
MLKDPSSKYLASEIINFPERTWVNKFLNHPPIWLSTDLRDGNQSLFNPMSVEIKTKFYTELIKVGLKEIEIGFPAASDIDYKFMRKLIEEDLIPDDVTIMIMTQARQDLILKTVEAARGCKRVIVHIYNATAPAWRDIVFRMSIDQVIDLIARQVNYLKQLTDKMPETKWILQYSPETFSSTEPEVALEACNTAIKAWMVNSERKIIINLPTTVENTTPNVFADRIEWISNRLQQRENVILSVHPHNDRGTGVATAELALLAGAQRVEGCLFGNGERCGNVDLVTLALNLYTQGINPGLDFSNINYTAKIVEEATQLPIHPRHPYVGDLVFTAFSGSHQDAIKKGFEYQQGKSIWSVPYLPIDPSDLGRSYANIIRVNSQSGKGGIAYIMENNYGITMPRRMQVEFSSLIQQEVDSSETEMQPEKIWNLFEKTYFNYQAENQNTISYVGHKIENLNLDKNIKINLELCVNNEIVNLVGCGNGTLDAAVNALHNQLQIISYEEKSLSSGADASAIAIIECQHSLTNETKFGVGKHSDITIASLLALVNVSKRLLILPNK